MQELCTQMYIGFTKINLEGNSMAGKFGVPFKLRVYSILIHLIVGILGSTCRIFRFEGKAFFEKLISGCDPVILLA